MSYDKTSRDNTHRPSSSSQSRRRIGQYPSDDNTSLAHPYVESIISRPSKIQKGFKLFNEDSTVQDVKLSILAPYSAATNFIGQDFDLELGDGHTSISPSSSKKTTSSRKKSLVRPERSRSSTRHPSHSTRVRRNLISSLNDSGHGSPTSDDFELGGNSKKKAPLRGCCSRFGVWASLAKCLTCCCCDCCLASDKLAGRKDPLMRQAWREKAALCILIIFSCLALGFLTFGLTTVVCRPPSVIYKYAEVKKMAVTKKQRWFFIHGYIYNLPEVYAPYGHGAAMPTGASVYDGFAGQDLTPFFPYSPSCSRSGFIGIGLGCKSSLLPGVEYCHSTDLMRHLERIGQVTFDWQDIETSKRHVVYNGYVLDIGYYLDQVNIKGFLFPFGKRIDTILRTSVGGDATKALLTLNPLARQCLLEKFGAGTVDIKSVGCILTDIILYVSLVAILAVIMIKFVLAVFFTIFFSRKLCDFEAKKTERANKKKTNENDDRTDASENQMGENSSEEVTLQASVRPRSASMNSLSRHSLTVATVDRGRDPRRQSLNSMDELESNIIEFDCTC